MKKPRFTLVEAAVYFALVALVLAIPFAVSDAEAPGSKPGAFIDLAIAAAWGWLTFLPHVASQMHFDWDGIAAFLVSLAGITFGGHYFLRWLYRSTQPANDSPARTWQWRWSLLMSASVIVLFVMCVTASFIYHDLAFLATTNRPVTRATLTPWPTKPARDSFSSFVYSGVQTPNPREFTNLHLMTAVYLQNVHLGYIFQPGGRLYAAVMRPRDAVEATRLGITVFYADPNTNPQNRPAADWPALLDELQAAATQSSTSQPRKQP